MATAVATSPVPAIANNRIVCQRPIRVSLTGASAGDLQWQKTGALLIIKLTAIQCPEKYHQTDNKPGDHVCYEKWIVHNNIKWLMSNAKRM